MENKTRSPASQLRLRGLPPGSLGLLRSCGLRAPRRHAPQGVQALHLLEAQAELLATGLLHGFRLPEAPAQGSGQRPRVFPGDQLQILTGQAQLRGQLPLQRGEDVARECALGGALAITARVARIHLVAEVAAGRLLL